MPSHRQLAAISPQTNIIPSIAMKQPSDAASMSADTMMNSYRQPSHGKNSFPSGHFIARREEPVYALAELDLTQSFPYGPVAIIIDSVLYYVGVFVDICLHLINVAQHFV